LDSEKRPKILIVDDDPLSLRVLSDVLSTDYEVLEATSGRKALEIASQANQPDLIVMDITMPEMDGYEVCRKLKENPQTRDIPVIFLTAKGEMEDEEMALNIGAVDYIAKPFRIPIIRARVRTHMSLKLKTDELERISLVDSLTNIPNRRRFDEALQVEWGRCQRGEATPLSLVMMDVDHFKAFNDHYGHGSGDECLRAVAKALANQVNRPADLVARFGGEEFVAMLPNTDAPGAASMAERFRLAVEALDIPHEYTTVSDHVTISAGYATICRTTMRSPDDLLLVADKALYQAKALGRNRTYG
jgi:diguanylate cyclase (GGDEF)-like protein